VLTKSSPPLGTRIILSGSQFGCLFVVPAFFRDEELGSEEEDLSDEEEEEKQEKVDEKQASEVHVNTNENKRDDGSEDNDYEDNSEMSDEEESENHEDSVAEVNTEDENKKQELLDKYKNLSGKKHLNSNFHLKGREVVCTEILLYRRMQPTWREKVSAEVGGRVLLISK